MIRELTVTRSLDGKYHCPELTKNWKGYDPPESFQFSHDLLDHTAPFDGSLEQELKALGAILFTRNIPELFTSGQDKGMAENFEMVFGKRKKVKGKVKKIDKRIVKYLEKVYPRCKNPNAELNKDLIASYMTQGYRYAQKRYKNIPQIEEYLNRLRRVLGGMIRGAKYSLILDYDNNTVCSEEIPEYSCE